MLKFRETRRLALVGATTAVALGSLASSAAAATNTTDHTAKFPLIGTQAASLTVSGNFPASVQVDTPTPPVDLTSKVTFAPIVSEGLGLIDGTATLQGTLKTIYTVTPPSGSPITVTVSGDIGTIGAAPLPNPLVLQTTSATPTLIFGDPGTATIAVKSFSANLVLRDASGNAIQLPTPSGTIDSDGNPDTFDVNSTLAPATQNTQLASIAILGGPIVGAPVVTDFVGAKPLAGIGGSGILRGTNLTKVKSVTVGGKAAKFTSLTSKTLAVTLPALPVGTYPVVVTTAKGASAPVLVTYVKRR